MRRKQAGYPRLSKFQDLARIAAFTFVITTATPVLRSADHTSSIVGKVVDQAGGPITGALIELAPAGQSSDSRATAATTADKRGNFKIQNISATVYTLRISAKGFKPSMTKVEAAAGRDANVGAIKLEFDCSTPGVFCDKATPSKP